MCNALNFAARFFNDLDHHKDQRPAFHAKSAKIRKVRYEESHVASVILCERREKPAPYQ